MRVFPCHRLDKTSEQVTEKEERGGKGQRGGHVEHGALAGLHPWLAHDLQAVGDRLDAGVGAAPQGVGPHEEQQDADHADGGDVVADAAAKLAHHRDEAVRVDGDPVDEHDDVGRHEEHEDRRQDRYRFLDAPDVEDDQDHYQEAGEGNLEVVILDRQVAEDRIHAGGDRDGDGHHVIDQQGAARNDPGLLPQHVGGHDVSAAAVGEVLDDARIGVGDDEDRQGHCHGQEKRKVGVLSQGPEGLFRTVGRG